MPKIVISGYFGFNNAGDEAILSSTVQTLRGLAEGLEITVLSQDPPATRAQHGVRAVHRLAFPLALAGCDLLLFGGGGLLQDVSSQRSLVYYLSIIGLAQTLGKKTMIYANSFGPIIRPSSAWMAARVLNRVDLITLRDALSLEELRRINVVRPAVEITADPALALERVDTRRGARILAEAGVDPEKAPVAAISVRPWKENRHIPVVARAADHLIEKYGAQVVLFSIQPSQDHPILKQVARLMKRPVRILAGDYGVPDLMSVLGNARLAVAMRLHALIFSVTQGTPALGLIYDPKIEGFLEAVGLPSGGRAEELSAERVLGEIDRLWSESASIRSRLEDARPRLRERARANAELALGLLGGAARGARRGRDRR